MDPTIQQMLEDLRDVHQPGTVGWWPLAPGWWILAILIISAVVATILIRRHRSRITAFRKEALRLLGEAHQDWKNASDSSVYLGRCAAILRRVLLHQRGRKEVAHLSGDEWRQLLQAADAQLSESSLNALLVEQYRSNPEFDGEMLYQDLCQYVAAQRPSGHV